MWHWVFGEEYNDIYYNLGCTYVEMREKSEANEIKYNPKRRQMGKGEKVFQGNTLIHNICGDISQ